MPRLRPNFVLYAHQQNPLLPYLLRSCRDLLSAHNELRWLQGHVNSKVPAFVPPSKRLKELKRLCIDRGRGKPLQYVIGSQPFGTLDIECKPGVLIPR